MLKTMVSGVQIFPVSVTNPLEIQWDRTWNIPWGAAMSHQKQGVIQWYTFITMEYYGEGLTFNKFKIAIC